MKNDECGKLATGNWQLETGNWQLETGNWQLATGSWQLAITRRPVAPLRLGAMLRRDFPSK
jgi:hypothetical protein